MQNQDKAGQAQFDVQTVGARAAQILAAVKAHPLYGRLTGSSMAYTDCWATFTGYPVISKWDLATDAGPLLTEALRLLALKAAVFEVTGDEQAAELLAPGTVDEMVHAVLAQFTVMTRLQTELGVLFPHATENERFTYERGGITDQLYAAAGWGEQPTRYWLGADEVNRRLAVLDGKYELGGIHGHGRRHDIDFDVRQGDLVTAG